jgi:hypothetical protein
MVATTVTSPEGRQGCSSAMPSFWTLRDQAEITSNECRVVVRTVPAERASEVMLEMMSGVTCSASCPHCGALYVFPGFLSIAAFIAQSAGRVSW